MHQIDTDKIPWKEENVVVQKPYSYKFTDLWNANIDLLKTLLTHPKRAMDFPFWIFITLFISTLACFSLLHSSLVILTSNFVNYESITLLTGFSRIFLSTIMALAIATPGVVMLWVVTPEITFKSTFKRFLFYYQTVVLFSFLGELFFSKFIIESSMKMQPLIVIFAGGVAVHSLQRALEHEPNIMITRTAIVFILIFSYLQAFLIVDELLPYILQDNIESPITELIIAILSMMFV